MAVPPFHYAFPVDDLDAAKRFYGEVLGCTIGRSAERWVDFDFFGHQLSAHLADAPHPSAGTNEVDGKAVPYPHFGVVLPWERFHELAERLRQAGVSFRIEPYIRFAGRPGEQATMFFSDGCGNHIEIKSFRNPADMFRKFKDS